MSDPNGRDDVSGDVGVKVEPDEMPTRALGTLAVALTVVVVALICGAVWLFNTQVASELSAKGYTDPAPISAEHGGAASWND